MKVEIYDKQPSPEYRVLQEQQALKAGRHTDAYTKLHSLFCAEFGLTQREQGFRIRTWVDSAGKFCENQRSPFDHTTIYGKNNLFTIVTQPYGVLPQEFVNIPLIPTILDCSEWGFYYPGQAKCYLLKVDLRQWKLSWHQYRWYPKKGTHV